MDKMLYLMNVDWNWIKQRPHFLAEELSKYYDVTIINQRRYSKKGFQNRKLDGKIVQINTIPRIDRYRFLKKINILIKRRCLSKLLKNQDIKYIYTTFPEQVDWIPDNYKGKIIYDCMDDHIGLTRNNDKKKEIKTKENKLINKADYIFISSKYLYDILNKRYEQMQYKKCEIIRNGFGGEILETNNIHKKNMNIKIAYFGTISDWFDFNVIEKSLNDFNNIEYLLMGPLHNGVKIPPNSRIKYLGTVEHSELFEKTSEAGAFIMPFLLDESIMAVDPVKLYEYINFDRNIICINYPEVSRFNNFVYFYKDYDEFKMCIKNICENTKTKYSMKERIDFLKENAWVNRGEKIRAILSE